MSAGDVYSKLRNRATEKGLNIQAGSGLTNMMKVVKMYEAVKKWLASTGEPVTDDHIYEVMEYSLENLCKSWHAYDLEAKRICERYYATHSYTGSGDPGRTGTGAGDPGQGSGSGSSGQSSSGEGEGEDDDGDGDGDGGDEGHGQSEGDEGDGEEGKGQGEGEGEGQGEGEEGEGEGKGKGWIPSPVPPTPEPEPEPQPVPQPQPTPRPPADPLQPPQPVTPNYIKPSIWDKVMRIVMWNIAHPGDQKNIMLVGPRGIGKTRMVQEIDKTLNSLYPEVHALPYMITSPQAKHEVAGYGDAKGDAVRTEFTKGYVSPGITLVEEIDRSEPSALIAMNAATANKIMDTPVIGMIEQNPLCTIIATANTAGTGATEEYITANQLDASTRDRYVYIEMEFEDRIANKIARGDKKLVSFIKQWNTACEYCGLIQNTCSYRAITDIKDLVTEMGFTIPEALEAAVLKYCVPKDNLKSILSKMRDPEGNEYAQAMIDIEAKMKATY